MLARLGTMRGMAFRADGPAEPILLWDLTTNPTQYSGRRVQVEGVLDMQGGMLSCPESSDGNHWCFLVLRTPNSGPSFEAALQLNDTENSSITSRSELKDEYGNIFPLGSPVRAAGTVNCSGTPKSCRLIIEVLEMAVAPVEEPAQAAALPNQPSPTAAVEQPTQPPPTPTQPACFNASEVTPEMVGQVICVQGSVLHNYTDSGTSYIRFSEERSDFFLLSYKWAWEEAVSGTCVRVSGEVEKLGSGVVMVISAKSEHSFCSE